MSDDADDLSNFLKVAGSRGGRARAEKLSASERSKIASEAARARWDAKVPTAKHTGTLRFGDTLIDCAVLPDGTRLISQGHIMRALGRNSTMGRRGAENDVSAPFLSAANLRPFVSPDLEDELRPIQYRTDGRRPISTGYPAAVLPEVCDVYWKAEESGRLLPSQRPAFEAAVILMRSLAKVGITALVDEATGYQDVRDRESLQRLLQQYVEEEFHPWVKTFPDEFFKEIYKLYRLEPTSKSNSRPQFIGRFINKYVYEQLPDGVLDELRRVNPANSRGNRSRAHHQHLTDTTGIEHLDKQIQAVITLMKISDSRDEFKSFFSRRFPDQRKVLKVQQRPDGQTTTLFELEDLAEE